jgi:hypothetical protein
MWRKARRNRPFAYCEITICDVLPTSILVLPHNGTFMA